MANIIGNVVNIGTAGGQTDDLYGEIVARSVSVVNDSIGSVRFIRSNAFRDCVNLTSVYFPNVSEIYPNAFYMCTSLTNISFPSVSRLFDSAFAKCSNLTSVYLPRLSSTSDYAFASCGSLAYVNLPSLQRIGETMFIDCTSLVSVSIQSATHILYSAFKGCTNLSVASFPNVVSIYSRAFESCTALQYISFPQLINIGDYAFSGCYSLEQVFLPSVTSIGIGAFSGCSGLASINLPLCTMIGNSAFYGCTNLADLSLPECVSIYSSAFENCTALTSIYLPKCSYLYGAPFRNCTAIERVELPSLLSIGAAFSGCTNLSFFSAENCVGAGTGFITGLVEVLPVDNLEVLYVPKVTRLNNYSTNSHFGSKLREIHAGCSSISGRTDIHVSGVFENCISLEIVDMPSLTNIGAATFKGCGLSSVAFPAVTSIGCEAFANCVNLSFISIPSCTTITNTYSSNGWLGVFEGCTALSSFDFTSIVYIGSRAFYGCTSLKSVIAQNLTSNIQASAFYECTALSRVELSGTYAGVSSSAFYNCSALTYVSLSGEHTEIDTCAFYGCVSLSEVHIHGTGMIQVSAFAGNTSLVLFDAPLISRIAYGAFDLCDSLEILSMPCVSTFYANTAYGIVRCANLTTVNFPAVTSWNLSRPLFAECPKLSVVRMDALSFFSWAMFYSCPGVRSLYFPALESIVGSSITYGIPNLNLISFPALKSIPASCFLNKAIVSAYVPSATYVGSSAFCYCYYLSDVDLTAAETIGAQAFRDCSAMSVISLPNAKTIGAYAFSSCIRLVSLYLMGSTVCSLAANAFANTPITGYITESWDYGCVYVPVSLYSEYISAPQWSNISSRIVSVP